MIVIHVCLVKDHDFSGLNVRAQLPSPFIVSMFGFFNDRESGKKTADVQT